MKRGYLLIITQKYSNCKSTPVRTPRYTSFSRGFTIVELLIVIVVIAILATITVVAYNGVRSKANDSVARSEIQQAAKSLEVYKTTHSEEYPLDWTAAQLAGVKLNSDATVNYFSNGATYCLQAERGDLQYFISTKKPSPNEGLCTPSGLVSWLPLNGNSTDALDASNAGVVTDAILAPGQDGQANGAYAFSGTTDNIASSFRYPTANGQPFTASVWTKGVSSSSNQWSYIARRGTGNDVGSSVWIMAIDTNGRYTLSVNGAYTEGSTGVSASATDWAHLVLSYDGTTMRAYVNGTLRVEYAVGSITRTLSGGTMQLGTVSAARYLVGSIDDFRLYNRVLSAPEISGLYTAGAQ